MHMYVHQYRVAASTVKEQDEEAEGQVFSGTLIQVQMELVGSCCTWLHSITAVPAVRERWEMGVARDAKSRCHYILVPP